MGTTDANGVYFPDEGEEYWTAELASNLTLLSGLLDPPDETTMVSWRVRIDAEHLAHIYEGGIESAEIGAGAHFYAIDLRPQPTDRLTAPSGPYTVAQLFDPQGWVLTEPHTDSDYQMATLPAGTVLRLPTGMYTFHWQLRFQDVLEFQDITIGVDYAQDFWSGDELTAAYPIGYTATNRTGPDFGDSWLAEGHLSVSQAGPVYVVPSLSTWAPSPTNLSLVQTTVKKVG